MASKGHIYEAEDGFRWHLKAGNGRIVAESGEAYQTEKKAQDAYDKVFGNTYALVLADGEEVEAGESEGQLVAASSGGGSFDALPQDPSHPLYSPYTVDGNK